ncbi:DsrE family protein [uncultured Thiohalocapsa sp.]|mgnify:CR=1 FL=1|uniref:DsrE family protein n=1 Tax=uncultured Thiohalocapsa sp. TaxID=768990 RepID=UPI0025F1D247|nr:DsrE family protein [uncultured Thiohalocapsa sp.]
MRIMLPSLLLALVLAPALALAGDKPKVVYHVSDENKVSFALNNIENHIAGVGGGENIEIVLVSHGPAVKQFNDIEAVDRVRNGIAALQEQGVTFEACANTLEALGLAPDELLPGFEIAEKGGVTRITELQGQGYAYIRP